MRIVRLAVYVLPCKANVQPAIVHSAPVGATVGLQPTCSPADGATRTATGAAVPVSWSVVVSFTVTSIGVHSPAAPGVSCSVSGVVTRLTTAAGGVLPLLDVQRPR